MLPIIGNPFGPGGYGNLRLVRKTRPNKNSEGMMNKSVIGKGCKACKRVSIFSLFGGMYATLNVAKLGEILSGLIY
jgi:hypothetical protein